MSTEKEKSILKSVDESGYSEKQTDLQIDKNTVFNVKMFNRATKNNQKKKQNDDEEIIFSS